MQTTSRLRRNKISRHDKEHGCKQLQALGGAKLADMTKNMDANNSEHLAEQNCRHDQEYGCKQLPGIGGTKLQT